MLEASKRLKNFRMLLEMSQQVLADELGIPQRTYASYEQGRLPPEPVLVALARKGLNLHWLITGVVPDNAVMIRDSQMEYQSGRETLLSGQPARVRVPIYNAPLSAGPGGESDDAILAYGEFMESWLRGEVRIDPGRAFIAPVRGDSMADRVFDGDLVLGEQTEIIDRDGVYAFVWNGGLYIKHVRRRNGTIQLVSENPIYGTEVVNSDDEFRVIGRVVRRITRLY